MGGARGGSCHPVARACPGPRRAARRIWWQPVPPERPASSTTSGREERVMASEAEHAAMRRALSLAVSEGKPTGPNPRVGCVLLAEDGSELASGVHRGAGTPHAEVDALARLALLGPRGRAASGVTAVVTLEPCNHTGRTGPCSQALVEAGVTRVVFGQSDTNPLAAGGAAVLPSAGVQVEGGVLAGQAAAVNPAWTFAVTNSRPLVTWKLAAT